MDRLDAAAIVLPGIEVRVLERCASTNTLLLEEGKADVLLAAEEQTAGRGRRGRRWYSAPGSGITFSLSRNLRKIAGLPLAAGVGVARALRALGASQVALKWPNDLVVGEAKLGGILVQARGPLAVIGVGINCRADLALGARLGRKVAFLETYVGVDRNEVVQRTGEALLEALATFEAQGLEPLRAAWELLDAHAGSRLRVRLADGRVLVGRSRGLAADGALRLETRSGLREVYSARVLRIERRPRPA